jgi:wyosine [tRNA(Phe)-imidazoG37] synthetase (radical SAM superfamily)
MKTDVFNRFINAFIPLNSCNLRCDYCYIGQTEGYDNNYDVNLHYSFEQMRLSLTPERLGGVCLFNLCAAGETTLFKELPELVKMLLELGHFVTIVTNATLATPLRIILDAAVNYKERLFIKCSLQYLEMMR